MAQTAANKLYNNFVGGLNTEASPLNYPENSLLDSNNFEINYDGTIKRRKGLDYENGYSVYTASVASTDAISEHEWRTVAGSSTTNFIVQQIGRYVYFYINQLALSAGKKSFSVDLDTYKVSGATTANVASSRIDAAYGRGVLFIVGKYIAPISVTYTPSTDSISVSQLTIEDRDFDGIVDSLGIDTRPSTLSEEHLYNLLNQGWSETYINSYKASTGLYPSSAQQWILGKYVVPSTGLEAFSAEQLDAQNTGNTLAPRGHYIRNIFNTTQSYSFSDVITIADYDYVSGTTWTIETASAHGFTTGDSITIAGNSFTYDNGSGCTETCGGGGDPCYVSGSLDGTFSITVTDATNFTISKTVTGFVAICIKGDTGTAAKTVSNPAGIVETYRPEAVTFFSGRAWYAGTESERLGSRVYFSQIINTSVDAGKCYQDADPTSEHISDLIDTDGGYISIPEIGKVVRMLPQGLNLILFADNGTWMVSAETGFKATGYSVRRVSNVGCSSPSSVVLAENVPIFIGDQGIYAMQEDKITGYLTAQSISLDKVQTLFNSIPDANRDYMKAVYDLLNKKVLWLYSDVTNATYSYNKALVFDTRLGSFYQYTLAATSPYAAGLATIISNDSLDDKIKVLAYNGTDVTYAAFNQTEFLDWYIADSIGVDAPGYIMPGYELLADTMRKKEAHYVFVYMNKTETGFTDDGLGNLTPISPSSCLMQYRWDWASSSSSGKFSDEQQVYRHTRLYIPSGGSDTFDTGLPVIVTKNKVRGNGRAIHTRFRTEAGKDCQMLGWAVSYVGRTTP